MCSEMQVKANDNKYILNVKTRLNRSYLALQFWSTTLGRRDLGTFVRNVDIALLSGMSGRLQPISLFSVLELCVTRFFQLIQPGCSW